LLEVTLRIVTLSARRTGATLAVGALALTSAACGSSSSSGASTAATSAAAAATSAAAAATSAGTAATSAAGSVAAATSAAATSAAGSAAATSAAGSAAASAVALPAAIKAAGVITIATDASYAPVESFAKDNKTIVGIDPDLGAAIGKELGVKVKFTNTGFDGIIPALAAGRFDMAMSAMTDNTTRQKTVDFVDYFSAGTSFMGKVGGKTVQTLADLCGLKVAVEKGTTEQDDATAQSKKCTTAGKSAVTVLPYPDQNGANLALSAGRADIVMADSPIVAYAAAQSKGQFVAVGTTYGTAPYGIAFPKTSSALRDAVAAALQKLIDDGTYKTVLAKWGASSGAVTKATVNGGTGS
jgi:polar amino acid transport system substrate-binding protein